MITFLLSLLPRLTFLSRFSAIVPFLTSPKFLLAAGIALTGAYGGYKFAENIWEAKNAKLQVELNRFEADQLRLLAEIKTLEKKAAEVSANVVTKYVDRVKIVREKGEQIIKEVPVYVTKEADANCPIPDGWVYIHDKAASGAAETRIPEAPGNPDETSTGVTLSSAAETITLNYQQYHALVEQLTALQNWITEQQKIYNQ